MDKFQLTKIISIVTFLSLVVYDLIQVFPVSTQASFSCVLSEWSCTNKFVPAVLGLIIGHLFFSSPNEHMNGYKVLVVATLLFAYCLSFWAFKDFQDAFFYDKRITFVLWVVIGAILWPI